METGKPALPAPGQAYAGNVDGPSFRSSNSFHRDTYEPLWHRLRANSCATEGRCPAPPQDRLRRIPAAPRRHREGTLSTRTGCPIALDGPPKRCWLVAKLMTATGAAPGRSSSESIRRPAAGDTARPRKYSPVTYSVLALVACPPTAGYR